MTMTMCAAGPPNLEETSIVAWTSCVDVHDKLWSEEPGLKFGFLLPVRLLQKMCSSPHSKCKSDAAYT